MWTYRQSTGELTDESGGAIGWGYSGSPDAKNDPYKQDQHNIGPIPRGLYTIGDPFDSATHGPFAMHLTPDPANEMYGRGGFMIHGDSVKSPGTASEGCVIMPRVVREQVWGSSDHTLMVEA